MSCFVMSFFGCLVAIYMNRILDRLSYRFERWVNEKSAIYNLFDLIEAREYASLINNPRTKKKYLKALDECPTSEQFEKIGNRIKRILKNQGDPK